MHSIYWAKISNGTWSLNLSSITGAQRSCSNDWCSSNKGTLDSMDSTEWRGQHSCCAPCRLHTLAHSRADWEWVTYTCHAPHNTYSVHKMMQYHIVVRHHSKHAHHNSIRHIVVEAHCYALQCWRIDCEQIRSRINQQLIAERFGPKAFVSCVQNWKTHSVRPTYIAKVYA